MIIKKPITATVKNRYKTVLHFEGANRVEFYMRGAIAWPEGDREGFAMMAGQNIENKTIFVFEQFPFWTVNQWLNTDGTIKSRSVEEGGGYHVGLVQAVQDWESRYRCCAFFYGGQHVDVIRRHSLELYRNPLLPKRIELVEVPYVSEVGDDLILEKIKTNGFIGQADSSLHRAVIQWTNLRATDTGNNNIVHCLRALLAGFESQPYVEVQTMEAIGAYYDINQGSYQNLN